ncbi:Glycosyltransferase involved in cell wall bisynthesis [Bryocella elongata]|uniref:Glycosyltransferase involved in cell wall bisynthesis n=1 Tax=Bryocella elongata TaxID=863522 RepID=A0A1H6CAJ1_9BACT|nr:bifunctional glycosyltransferase family 2/GtrA family protein [Bryocella elongata]SEG69903.1 Glycosyltransferase involved in cell wall bisynthesis [Bryocella elongata]
MHPSTELPTKSLTAVYVVIPAREPEPVLAELVGDLIARGFAGILVLNDGSSADAEPIFRAAQNSGAKLLTHAVNLGKGRALKTAFNHVLSELPGAVGIVTADADGQHTVADIVRVAEALVASNDAVLGARSFAGSVPLRSRFGNVLTRYVFALATGAWLGDTQSGLRGIPTKLLPGLMTLEGERYEFEMNMLAHLCSEGKTVLEIPIETVYIDGNRSSHFSPIWDSMRIYFVLARFVLSSVVAACLDLLLFLVAFRLTGHIGWSVIAGRTSSLVNFTLNRQFVFRSRGGLVRSLLEYYLLVAVVALGSYAAISMLAHRWGWQVFSAKLLVDSLLSLVSFSVQRTFVFRRDARIR